MSEREYLVKAQEADAIANEATNSGDRRRWESIAYEYRRRAALVAVERQLSSFAAKGREATKQEVGDMADKITRATERHV